MPGRSVASSAVRCAARCATCAMTSAWPTKSGRSRPVPRSESPGRRPRLPERPKRRPSGAPANWRRCVEASSIRTRPPHEGQSSPDVGFAGRRPCVAALQGSGSRRVRVPLLRFVPPAGGRSAQSFPLCTGHPAPRGPSRFAHPFPFRVVLLLFTRSFPSSRGPSRFRSGCSAGMPCSPGPAPQTDGCRVAEPLGIFWPLRHVAARRNICRFEGIYYLCSQFIKIRLRLWQI